MALSFKCHPGLIALGAICIATCAAAFSGNTYSYSVASSSATFVGRQINQQTVSVSPVLMKLPLLLNNKNNH
eukprot:CAMPEP_0119027440 /NCGR_PEP_ID=MMETSP1176-20130426/37091_1 /TAXON_ID=265551 /ORGANISM="Synedropsis recta cf, Strain CCMP1620" /LENGTH=71 /DNA_ID=CAMNT_0006983361 /DNA_START=68 /DNA_END=280 /DNA_ORIENTATION=-